MNHQKRRSSAARQNASAILSVELRLHFWSAAEGVFSPSKKSAREFFAGALSFYLETTLPLRLRRCRGGCLLLFDNAYWLLENDSSHNHSITNFGVIDGSRHVRADGRPGYGVTFRIHNGSVVRVVISHRCYIRLRSERKVIRIRRVFHDCAGTGGRCRLCRRGTGCRVRCRGRCCGLLRQRCHHRCRTSRSNCQHFH